MGKILDYFDSEERAYDVLETTCDGLKDYALGKGENRALQWLQMDGEKKTRQKMLVSSAGELNEKNARERFRQRLEGKVEDGREEVNAVVSTVFGRSGGTFVEAVEREGGDERNREGRDIGRFDV